MISSISISDFLELKNINIIDIRPAQNYNNNHIAGALNIPYQKLLLEPNKYLDRNKIYYIYCQSGITSRRVANILTNQGYNVVNINGGYEGWLLQK